MSAPINLNRRKGRWVVIAPAATIYAAIESGDPLTITDGSRYDGDQVYIRAIFRAPSSGHPSGYYRIADEFTHPRFGDIAVAYVDEDRTARAPALATEIRKGRESVHATLQRVAAEDARLAALDD